MANTPLIFDKYEVTRRLAVGGMGEIFLARQTGVPGFERLVILKRLLSDFAGQPAFVEQFLDEARVAATLNHPNIVSIFEVGLWQGNYFIAMEYIHGYSLVSLIRGLGKRQRYLPPAVGAKIIHDAALGLDHAHQARDVNGRPLHIVHRDISPPNIMLRDDGHVKVVDFGIARAANRAVRTSTGALKGKIGYMPPEQLQGEELDGRSDQYSLGVVLWELLCRRRLYHDDNPIKVLHAVLDRPVPPPSAIVEGIPEALDQITCRMVTRNRDERFQSCAEVARALRRFIDLADPEMSEERVGELAREVVGPVSEEQNDDLPISGQDFLVDLRQRTPDGEFVVTPFSQPGAVTLAQPPRRARAPIVVLAILLGVVVLGLGGLLTRELWRAPTQPVAAAASPSPTQPPAAKVVAPPIVRLESTPAGATVLAGNRVLGVTPLVIDTLAAEVEHLLLVERRGFEAQEVRVRLAAGEEKQLAVELARSKSGKKGKAAKGGTEAVTTTPAAGGEGYLTLKTTPWTNVSIDGELYGPSPLFKIKLPAGEHTVVLVNEQHGVRVTRKVTIRAGQTEKVDWALKP